jgi:tetraacyldisaccharide 4'-kinase
VLTFASRLYAIGARGRRSAIEGNPAAVRRLDRPVVSVGNLSVGGTGKTPLVAWIASRLIEAGERPAILSRGYGRSDPDDGVTVVNDGVRLRADLARAGDEPLMLARALPKCRVLVCADRYLAGRVAELHLGATVHILDDGFQHFGLARDVDLLVIDPADFERPMTLPAGRLREPEKTASRADALIVAGDANARIGMSERLGVEQAFSLVRQVGVAVEDAAGGPQAVTAPARVVLVSGIARPARFEEESKAAGYDVAASIAFADHHGYLAADVARISEAVRSSGAACVLTTEKDLMRLLPLRPLPFRVAVRPLHVRVEPETFMPWLLERLAGSPVRSAGPELVEGRATVEAAGPGMRT